MEYCQASTQAILELMYCAFSKRCDLESYSGIKNGLLCTNARTKVDCKNFCDVGITDEQGEKNSSNEDDYEEIWNSEGSI